MDLSIIIPFYKRLPDVFRLVKSIYNSLESVEYKMQVELLVIIDSPENTLEELENVLLMELPSLRERLGLKIIHNGQNLGVAKTRNKGLALAKGTYIHIIDQDDEVHPDFYKRVWEALKKADWVLVNGLFCFDEANKQQKIYYLKPRLNLKNFVLDDFLRSPGQVVFANKLQVGKAFISVENSAGADDRFFWIQQFALNPSIKASYIHKPLYIAHIHACNFSADSNQLYQCCLSIWEKWDFKETPISERWVKENMLALRYILEKETSILSFFAYISYKYRINRILRFVIKKVLLA